MIRAPYLVAVVQPKHILPHLTEMMNFDDFNSMKVNLIHLFFASAPKRVSERNMYSLGG